MSTSTDRLARLFNLLPYLSARPDGVELEAAAADFGITVEQLRSDLMLLFLCGLPGYSPGDLVDISIEADRAQVRFDAGLSRPVRLSMREALALSVALQALASTPGVEHAEAVRSALDKIAAAAGGVRPKADIREAAVESGLDVYRDLIAQRRAARIVYYTATRDTTTERIVEPTAVQLSEGHAYLVAWCRSAEGMRHFRLDRIDALTPLEETFAPREAPETAPGEFLENFEEVELLVDEDALSLAENYPCRELGTVEGRRHIALRVYDQAWAARLVAGYGGHVSVVRPESLRNLVRSRAAEALERYGQRLG
ncbi:helix-turn-helix transcriptional regulator [Salininema proteolyticum]|uniref:Helix-turn-helix transcriptional regulator n=1 Tax=Salininema proteolyticum TaxID=1607685 RepID=A0ABV8U355_9ACTN